MSFLQKAHHIRGWCLALGIVLVVIGCYAIWAESIATLASVILLGVLVFIAGIAQLLGAFMVRGAGHVILLLLMGALDVFVGFVLMQHPGLGALAITLFLAALLTVGGIYRFIAALWLQIPHSGWIAFSGLLSFVLGILLWLEWPSSAFWFIGLAVGINFIMAGIAWSSLAWRLRAVPAQP
jgi:uncharacterized membrane protein HdeD (DUF308 family)